MTETIEQKSARIKSNIDEYLSNDKIDFDGKFYEFYLKLGFKSVDKKDVEDFISALRKIVE